LRTTLLASIGSAAGPAGTLARLERVGGWSPALEQQQPDTLDLRDYLAVLRRRRWIVIQTVLVVFAVALAVTFVQTPRYEASVQLVVEPNVGAGTDSVLNQLVFGQRELETQKELVTSELVAEKVIRRLDLDRRPDQLVEQVSVDLLRDTQILTIRATSTDAEEAAAIAQQFAVSYLDFRQEQALEQVLRASEALQEREDETRDRLRQIEIELTTASEADAATLRREQELLNTELAQLSTQKAQLSATSVLAGGGGRLARNARVPEAPFSPKPLRTAVLALVLGAMLGVGLAFLRDFLDDAIRSEEQAERAANKPVLGHVPRWISGVEGDSRLVTLVEPSSPVAESYRSLRTNVRFLSVGRQYRSLLITSAGPGEGKTTTAANLAVVLARAGSRVLLVGADLRKPAVHRVFGLEASPGLSDVLVGDADLVQTITDVGVPNLRVIPAGQTPPNPAELLGSPAMAQLMNELEQIADLVIYDGPPTLAVADSAELSPKVGGVVLVVDTGATGRNQLRAAAQRLEAVGASLSGLVLNNIDLGDSYYGYGYYGAYAKQPSRT